MKRILLILFILFNLSLHAQEECTSCHEDIKTNCGLTCISCHQGENIENFEKEHHPAVISNPSRAEHWQQKCENCHADKIENFKNSKHYSLVGIIAQTRFLWGKSSQLNFDSKEHAWQSFKNIKIDKTGNPAELVDRLLVQKCFACHFNADGKNNKAK